MTTYDPFNKPVLLRPVESGQFRSKAFIRVPVSYTHLTLPTIYSV